MAKSKSAAAVEALVRARASEFAEKIFGEPKVEATEPVILDEVSEFTPEQFDYVAKRAFLLDARSTLAVVERGDVVSSGELTRLLKQAVALLGR